MLESGCLDFNVAKGGVMNPLELATTGVGLPFNNPRKTGRKSKN